MNKRLSAIYSRIPAGRGVIDVGTDHGYIPAALFRNGYSGNIIASDINAGPLEAARKNAAAVGAEQKIEFLLCDGLALCEPTSVDTVVIAGMGGDTICSILDAAEWCCKPEYTLVLQPMTRAEVLRYWLYHNGFTIEREELVRDGRLYQLFTARAGEYSRVSDAELYTGKYELISGDTLFPEYLSALIKRFEAIGRGMNGAFTDRDISRGALNRRILSELHEMREKLEKQRNI